MYKNAARELESDGHTVRILGRDYDCTVPLLEYYGLTYELYGKCDPSKFSLFRELPNHYTNIFRKVRELNPDLIFGYGAYSAHAGTIAGAPVITVFDSEPTRLDHLVSKPFTSVQLTPTAFRKDLGDKHYTFNGFKETAYLHPDVFETTNNGVEDELDIGGDEPYVLLRFNAFGSHHDLGESGFTVSEKERLIDELSTLATVFVSDEGDQLDVGLVEAESFDLHPAKIHDALAHASLLVADTQTMVTEAALLGTPAIRSNSFVGDSDMGNFKELEARNLIHNERTLDAVLDRANAILTDPSAQQRWQERRESYIGNCVNLTRLIVDIATEFEESDEEIEQIVERKEELT